MVNLYPIEAAIVNATHAGQGGTGGVAILTAAERMQLMPFAQIAIRIGGAIVVTPDATDFRPSALSQLARGGLFRAAERRFGRETPGGRQLRSRDLEQHFEAAPSRGLFRPDAAVMQLDDAAADREPEAAAALVAARVPSRTKRSKIRSRSLGGTPGP